MSKAMEPAVASTLAQELQNSGMKHGCLIADDDAATIKKIREEVDAGVQKWAELSHTKKKLQFKIGSGKGNPQRAQKQKKSVST